MRDVLVLSNLCITSQPLYIIPKSHNTDYGANSHSPTLKFRMQCGEQLVPLFATLVCLCPGANPVPPDFGADTFSCIREHNVQINSAVTAQQICASVFYYMESLHPVLP